MVNGVQHHTRVPNRLQGYDYSQNGAYFITFCTQGRGNGVEQAILQIPDKYPTVHLEKYAVMPNHVHLLLLIQGDGRALRAPTVSNIVQQ